MPNPENLTPWKPGQSGNPAGAKKGAKHISTHIREMLNDEEFTMWLSDPRDGFKEYKGAPMKAIIKTALIKAAAGEKDAREWIAKYGYGQKLEVEHSGAIETKTLTDEELNARIRDYLDTSD
jgi:hypothetical protein